MSSYTARVIARLPMVREARGPKVIAAQTVAEMCRDLEGLAQETFQVLTMDQKNRVIDRHLVFLGTLTGTLVHPREVFRHAIMDSAAAILLVHNHPSGDVEPSRDDREITTRLVEAARILGFRVLDHVIIGREGKFLSFCEKGLL